MTDSLGDRMKKYEKQASNQIDANLPVFVRLDGKAFHTWVKIMGCEKPFDESLSYLFQTATVNTCQDIGQVIMAYSQSDEVTFLLSGWQHLDSQIYFGGKSQKITSVIASIFTGHFIRTLLGMNEYAVLADGEIKLPSFDARVFNVPVHEIENVFIWRQMDAKRNSIQSIARSLYSHKELNGKSSKIMLDMIKAKDLDWNDLPIIQKLGFVVKKDEYIVPSDTGNVVRTRWIIDNDIPFFVDESEYITDLISAE